MKTMFHALLSSGVIALSLAAACLITTIPSTF